MQTKTENIHPTEVDERRREVALFRYGVMADLVRLEPHHRGLYALLTKKAEHEYTIPGSLRRHVAAETVRGWLRAYRRAGFDGLVPRERADQGRLAVDPCPRRRPALPAERGRAGAVDSDAAAQARAHAARRGGHGGIVLPESTVHRVLARRGLMKKKPAEPTSKDRRRFEHESAGNLWMSDVMYGPKLREAGRVRRTYLIALIDDATRVVPSTSSTF